MPAPAVHPESAALTRRGLLARNIIWNMLGVGLPTLAAVLAIPPLAGTLGEARFGLLSLAWMFIGYFTIFDLGLSLALTKIVSARIASQRSDSLTTLVGTALLAATLVAILSAAAVWLSAPRLVTQIMNVPAALHGEALGVVYVLALSVPFVIIGSVLRGVLEAFQRFDLVNLVRLANGLYLFLGPLLVLPWTHDMPILVAVLAAGKAVSTLVFTVFCLRLIPGLRRGLPWRAAELRELFLFGGWITLGNIIGPILTYTDQFMIGTLVSVALVGYYLVPYQMITKLWAVTVAVVGVLFPALSIHLVSDRPAAQRLFLLGMKSVVLLVAPFAFLAAAFAGDILQLWLDAEHGRIGGPLLQVFALGVLINAFSFVTLALVQASGKPDWVPKLFMLELPFYLPALYLAIDHWGLIGAVIVWLAKIVVDFIFLLWACTRVMPTVTPALRAGVPGFLLLFASFVPLYFGPSLEFRYVYSPLWLACLLLLSWRRLLSVDERMLIGEKWRALRKPPTPGAGA